MRGVYDGFCTRNRRKNALRELPRETVRYNTKNCLLRYTYRLSRNAHVAVYFMKRVYVYNTKIITHILAKNYRNLNRP